MMTMVGGRVVYDSAAKHRSHRAELKENTITAGSQSSPRILTFTPRPRRLSDSSQPFGLTLPLRRDRVACSQRRSSSMHRPLSTLGSRPRSCGLAALASTDDGDRARRHRGRREAGRAGLQEHQGAQRNPRQSVESIDAPDEGSPWDRLFVLPHRARVGEGRQAAQGGGGADDLHGDGHQQDAVRRQAGGHLLHAVTTDARSLPTCRSFPCSSRSKRRSRCCRQSIRF